MAELKAKGGNVTLAEATDLDLAEKSEAAELKTRLENELRKNGRLTTEQAGQLSQAKATLARHAPMDPGPPPPVPQAVNDLRTLGKRDPATLTQQEAHQLANAQRAVARRGLDNLRNITAGGGTLSRPQQDAHDRFQSILAASRYNADLPPGPPAGYDPAGPYPIDHDHIIKAEFNKKGKATGGHSLLNGDVRIVPGTEGAPNAQGVYEAAVEMKKADGTWVKKKSVLRGV